MKTVEKLLLVTEMTGYTTGCLLDRVNFRDIYKTIAVDLSKQQALDADPRAIQQIKFTAHLDKARNTIIFSFLRKQKKLFLAFHNKL